MINESILIVVAHPDDEVLGCGGAIAKHCKNGDDVSILFLSDGVGSRDESNFDEKVLLRQKDAKMACSELGVENLRFESFPDNRLDHTPVLDIVKIIENEISKYKPSLIYTHHSGDVNIDNRCVHNAVVTACRPQPGFSEKKLLFFETLSSTEWMPSRSMKTFIPNFFIDISEYLTIKQKAMSLYESELRVFPHPRSIKSIEHLASWRGSMIGVNAAEAFEVGRIIV